MNLPLSLSKCQPCWNGPCSLCQPRSNCSVGPNVAKNNVDYGGILRCILVSWWLRDASEPPDSEQKGGHCKGAFRHTILAREPEDFPPSQNFRWRTIRGAAATCSSARCSSHVELESDLHFTASLDLFVSLNRCSGRTMPLRLQQVYCYFYPSTLYVRSASCCCPVSAYSCNNWTTCPSYLPAFPAEQCQLDCAVVHGWKRNVLEDLLEKPPPSAIGWIRTSLCWTCACGLWDALVMLTNNFMPNA